MDWRDGVYRNLDELKPGDAMLWYPAGGAIIESIERPRDVSGRWLIRFRGGDRAYFDAGERILVAPPG